MTAAVRPRRSALYVPGANLRALEKARDLPADVLILDLEDAVAPEAKESSRDNIATAVRAGGYGRKELLLRVNAAETAWGADDLAFAATLPVQGVLLPKVENGQTVVNAASALAKAGVPGTPIWCMMETPLGMLHAEEIAASHPDLAGFVMGTSDLAKDLHAHHTRERLPLLTGLGLCLLAARAYRLVALDGVYLDLSDDEGFAYSCRQGLEFGFDGKTLIHPKTVAKANEVFGPSEAEVTQARRIIAAFEAAQAEGKGVVVVDGKLVENLHVVEAQRLIALAEAIEG